MKISLKLFSLAFCLSSSSLFVFGQTVPGNWSMTYQDEFNNGQSDLNGWTYDLGNNNGWGNGELENYTNSLQNVNVANGDLNITAIASGSQGNQSYTSGRLQTDHVFNQKYGLFEFRAKMPQGQGLWPALWMYPQNSVYGSWPNSGEIDVMEGKGQDSTLVQGSLHSGTSAGSEDTQTQTFLGSGLEPQGFSTSDWHTYDLEWDAGTATTPATMKWYVDGINYFTQTGGWVVPGSATDPSAPFDQPFYLVMNLAVGGSYVGNPNLSNGSYTMSIDYIRAYEPQAVPSPSGASLFAVGVLGLGLAKRFKQSS